MASTLFDKFWASQAEHAQATSTLRLREPGRPRVRFEGTVAFDVSAQDPVQSDGGVFRHGRAA